MFNKKMFFRMLIIILIGILFATIDTKEKPLDNYYLSSITAQGLSIYKYIGLGSNDYKSLSGDKINVAIIDSGISYHKDINSNRILFFKDFVSNKNIRYDDYGHGTFVAGIIGANGKLKGIAPKVNFVVLKALDRFGQTNRDTLYAAFDWVYKNYEKYSIKVVNLSVGVTPYLNYESDPLCKLIEQISNKGITVICSAGNIGDTNDSNKIMSPGISPYVITVGSCKNNRTFKITDDKMASFSVSGIQFSNYSKPDLVTLGVDILSLDYKTNDSYVTHSGTSLSCAIVTGFAALLYEKCPNISTNKIRSHLIQSTIELKNEPRVNQGFGELFAK